MQAVTSILIPEGTHEICFTKSCSPQQIDKPRENQATHLSPNSRQLSSQSFKWLKHKGVVKSRCLNQGLINS